MQRYFLIHLLAFLFLVFSPRLYTEEIDLQQLLELSVSDLTDIYISVASKREELIHAAPGVITVLSADQLQQYGVRNLFDMLDMIPNTLGLSSAVMRDNLSSTRAQQAVAQDRHTLILINGRPFVDAFYGGRSQPLYTSFPISEVKQIEVVRGPGSVLYGSNAMSTIINIVTKDTASDSEIALTAGSFNTFTLEASHSGHYLNSENHLGLYINDSEGWEYAAVDASNTFHEENYGYQNKGAWLEINRQKFSLALFHVWLKSERLGARPLWPSEVTHLHRLFLDIGYQQYINDWEINSHVTINETDGKLPTVDDRHVTVELDAKRSFLERMNLYFKLSHILLEADDRVSNPHQNNIDSYSNTFAMQLDYQFTDPYKLVIGVQANDPEMTELDYSGRVGIIGAYDSGWGWKLLYGEAFRSPYLLELFAQIQYVAIGNPNLEPEEIYSWDWQIFYRQEKSFYSVTLYKSDQENTIYIDPSTRIFQNVTSLEFSGIEIEWQQIVLPRLVFEGSISVQRY